MFRTTGDRKCHHIEDDVFVEYPKAEAGFLFYRGCNLLLTCLYIFLYSSIVQETSCQYVSISFSGT